MASHEIFIYASPWENEARTVNCDSLTPGKALATLELNHPDIPTEILDGVIPSEWYNIDNGRMFLELRNSEISTKKGLPIIISDFDDCIMSTTTWHNTETSLLNQNPQLNSRQISISPDNARKIYEMSKILVPGKAEHEKRYTPRLNFIFLTQFAQHLSIGLPPEKAMESVMKARDIIINDVTNHGDTVLSQMRIDQGILDAIQHNSPEAYLHKKFVTELFQNPDQNLHVIVTRGKPEGLLGQVYKVHGSGVLDHSIDLVFYTNDIKAEALLVLSKIIPWMQSAPINLYDDNPSEVLPYLKFIRERNINNMKVIHVRHPDSKRKDIEVGETPIESSVDEETQTRFDVYHPNRSGTV